MTEPSCNSLYSIEAEKAVLGSMFIRPDLAIDQVWPRLNHSDFFVESHQQIFSLLVEMYDHSDAIDIPTCHQRSVSLKIDAQIGSPGVFAELVAYHCSHLNISSYIRIVEEMAMIRRLHNGCINLSGMITGGETIGKLVEYAESMISKAVLKHSQESQVITAQMVSDKTEKIFRDSIKNKGKLLGVPTGFNSLDRVLCGFEAPNLVIVGARPGVGKSILMMQSARYAAQRGVPVGIVTLEMADTQLWQRAVSEASGVSLRRIRQGDVDAEQEKLVIDTIQSLRGLPIYMEDLPRIKVANLRSKARRLKAKFDIGALWIDYAQLISGSEENTRNRYAEMSEVAREGKNLAKELNIPVIMLAQLNRAADDCKPHMGNLKETGEFEAAADTVMLLHRTKERTDMQKQNDLWPTTVIVDKNRNGPTGELEMLLEGRYCRLKELEPVQSPPPHYQDTNE